MPQKTRNRPPDRHYKWGKAQGIENVRMLPDGNAQFTRKMGMLVNKDNLGFGVRSWRNAMVVNDGQIEVKNP